MIRETIVICAALAAIGAMATTTTLPGVPSGIFPTPESSSCHPLQLNRDKLQEVVFRLDVPDCTDNEVIVAIGTDDDEDGDLSYEETDLFLGNDCGSQYLLSRATGEMTVGVEKIKIKAANIDPDWDTIKVIKRGLHVVNETVSITTDDKKFVISVR